MNQRFFLLPNLNFLQLLICFSLLFLITSCAATEETLDDAASEMTAAEAEESRFPEWFREDASASAEEGTIVGFTRLRGSSNQWAEEKAREQAEAKLKFWVDQQLEQAREEVSKERTSAEDPEFILQLRNAVQTLDLSNANVQSESVEEEGIFHGLVRLETPSQDLLLEIGQQLGSWSGLWQEMTETASLSSW